jgi:hypothetical protein
MYFLMHVKGDSPGPLHGLHQIKKFWRHDHVFPRGLSFHPRFIFIQRSILALLVLKGHRMGDQNLLSRAASCFGMHVKLLVLAVIAVVTTRSSFKKGLTSGRWPVVKIIAESLSQYDENHVVPTPLSGIRVGRK